MLTENVKTEIVRLRARRTSHFDLAKVFLNDPRQLKLDILAHAVLKRSLCLLRGFCDLVESRNMISAVPLMRCQLDNGLRFFASSLVDNPHDLAEGVVKGIPLNRVRDREGNFMTDAHLARKLTTEVPWAKSLYDQACGYVHLSEHHIINTIGIPDDDGTITIGITEWDGEIWTEALYLQAIEAFDGSTSLVLEILEMWAKVRTQELQKLPMFSTGRWSSATEPGNP